MSEHASSGQSPNREQDLRRLIELERQSAALRDALGLEHRLMPPAVTDASERAVFELIARFAADVFSIHAADGTVLWISPSVERLFHWTPAQMIGRSAYDTIHPDDRERIADNHVQHVEDAVAEPIEYRFLCGDGGYRWVRTHSTNCKDDKGVPQIVCYTQDVSERRLREEELARLVREYERAAERGDAEGLLRMCAWCKNVCDHDQKWQRVEVFLADVTRRSLTHGICPDCLAEARLER